MRCPLEYGRLSRLDKAIGINFAMSLRVLHEAPVVHGLIAPWRWHRSESKWSPSGLTRSGGPVPAMAPLCPPALSQQALRDVTIPPSISSLPKGPHTSDHKRNICPGAFLRHQSDFEATKGGSAAAIRIVFQEGRQMHAENLRTWRKNGTEGMRSLYLFAGLGTSRWHRFHDR